MGLWVFIFPNPLSKKHVGSSPHEASWHPAKPHTQLEWLVQILGRFGKHHLHVQLLIIHTLNQFHGTAHFHPSWSHKGTFVNIELTLPPASQGLD